MSAPRLLILVGATILALAAPAGATQVQQIAGGLDNPRHLAFGGHTLYVAEAGRGGDGPCVPGAEGGTTCVGATGAVTAIDRHVGQRRLVEGLASIGDEGTGANALGPHGITVDRFNRVIVTNGGPDGADRDALAAQNPVADLFGRVLGIGRDGSIQRLVDVWGFERDNNADGQVGNPEVDSNAVDVLVKHHRFVIADAGGNTLLNADESGAVSVLTVFPNQIVPDPAGGDDIPMQAVPTGVVKGPRGDYFMSQLTGFPFPVGGANVFRVDPRTGEATVFAGGFTNIMDLAFDRHGTLWVLEIDHDSLLGPSTDGAIYAVDPNGAKTLLDLPPGTLTAPGGITVGDDGALYVTNKANSVGDGTVLRIDLRDGGHGHWRD
ncbi:MAG TPA: ScyD/ScyE family protein [Baekduia sp.]|jgi:DNA-binding beta-propeller fold protein YncE